MFPKTPLPPSEWQKRLSELGAPKAQLISPIAKPKTLLEMYGVEPRRLYQDVLDRPKHYTEDQQQTIEHLFFKRSPMTPPTTEQLDALFYRWQEKTEQAKQRKEIVKKVTDISEHAELEGPKKAPTYEKQDYGKLIKLI